MGALLMQERSTGERQSGNNDARRVAPAPVAADVGIVAAMPMEVADLLSGLKKVSKYQSVAIPVIEGEHAGKIVAVAIAGMGRAAAARATEVLIAGHRPRWLISAGFAGALNPVYARNDLVLVREVIDREESAYPVSIPPKIGAMTGLRHAPGRLLTVDRVVLRAAEKEELHRTYQADLVDMETSAVAGICAQRGCQFLSIRIISDDAHADLPDEVASVMNPSGVYRVGATLRSLWRRPGSLRDFWLLYEHSIEAAGQLSKFVLRSLDELPA
jgi:adenosylhomocysteine nucleosidase